VTDSERRVVWQAEVHDNGAADVLPASTIELPLRASNQYFDAETGLHYNLNRYLDAVRGRYLSPDPLGLATGPDLYQFALGHPHQFIDLLGLQTSTASIDWSQTTPGLESRLIAIVQASIPKLPGAIGSALQQLITPSGLAKMGVIFVAFTAAQATPVGWIADGVLLGWSAWMLGSGVVELMQTLSQLYTDAKNAKCDADINTAAQRLANSFVSSGGQIVAGLAGVFGSVQSGGTTRIAGGLNKLIDFAESSPEAAEGGGLVIGKLPDLEKLGAGEHRLILRDLGNPKANWLQNSSVLREEMSLGQPIRDASVDPLTGELINNTGFLRAERNLLDNHGWTYNPSTRMWYPPAP
jgi:RHS repeat-associated protein